MNYRNDKIKILEMICSKTLPESFTSSEDIQEISFTENDFKEEGLSYTTAILIFKDIVNENFVHSFKGTTSGKNLRGVLITVTSDVDKYTKSYKYSDYEIEQDISSYGVNSRPMDSKTKIMIDDRKGIYRTDNPTLVYKIQIPSKRFDLILFLAKEDKVSLSDIAKKFNQTPTLVMKEMKTINKTFQSKLKVFNDLIARLDTSGYCLNRDKFDIQP